MSDFWLDPSSTSILHVCKQRRLWWDCTDAQARLSLRCCLWDKYHNLMSWLICCFFSITKTVSKVYTNAPVCQLMTLSFTLTTTECNINLQYATISRRKESTAYKNLNLVTGQSLKSTDHGMKVMVSWLLHIPAGVASLGPNPAT